MAELLHSEPIIAEESEFLLAALYRHENGGIVLPPIDNEVGKFTYPKSEDRQHGTFERSTVTMTDGTHYDVIMGTPKVKGSSLAIVSTPPLFIPLEHKHNLNAVDDMLELDYPIVAVGPPRGRHAKNNPASIAHDTHKILNEILPSLEVDEEKILISGESRGAIIGTALCVQQYALGRITVFADLRSPCAPRPPKIGEWPEVLAYAPIVTAKIGGTAIKKFLGGDLSDLKNLISDDPSQALNALKFFRYAASSGIAGKLAIASDPRTHMHINLHTNDTWAPVDDWRLAYRGRENVTIDEEPGGHEQVASLKTREDTKIRFEAIKESGGQGRHLTHREWLEIMQAHRTGEEDMAYGMDEEAISLAA